MLPLIDFDMHVVPVRLAARLLDPDAFIISAAMLKTHNMAIATLSMKNMVLGAPLHQAPKETKRWNDKRRYHVGIRQSLYNFFLTAQKMQPYWGAAVIDGFEGMEGNGPSMGTPVRFQNRHCFNGLHRRRPGGRRNDGHRSQLARLAEVLRRGRTGTVGSFEDRHPGALRSPPCRKKYRLHPDIDRMLKWMGPMEELPPNLGWVRPIGDIYPA